MKTWGQRLAAVMVLFWAQAAWAEIQIHDAWSPAMPAGVNKVPVYMVLTNLGQSTDRLLSARSEAAGSVSIHASQLQEGEWGVVSVEQVQLPSYLPVSLDMGTSFLVLNDLQQALRPGSRYNLTLQFAGAPEQTIRVRVRSTNFFGSSNLEGLRTDPMQQPGRTRRSEGLEDVMSDPFLR